MTEIKAERTSGKNAQNENIRTAIMVADIVKSTLGPKGMDKFLVNPSTGKNLITNDGVTILENIEITHPLAKVIVDASRTQEDKVGDGTTSVAMLSGKFLEKALELMNKGIHATTILKGYSLAEKKAKEIVNDIATEVTDTELNQIVHTALTGKSAEDQKELLGEILTKAITLTDGQRDNILINKIVSDEDSELIEGIVLNKDIPDNRMPKELENPNILLLDMPLEYKQPEQDLTVNVSSFTEIQDFKKAEENYLEEISNKIINSGVNVVFCTKTISQYVLNKFSQNGILAFRNVGYYDTDALEKNTDAKLCKDLDNIELGTAKKVKQVVSKTDSLIYVEECPKKEVVTLILKGNTKYIQDELYRAVTDAIGDLISMYKDRKVLPGGGAVEIHLSNKLHDYAKTIGGKEQIAIQKYAESFEFIPETLAENAGLDQINYITELKAENEKGNIFGLNLFTDKVEDTLKQGIIEPLKVKTQAISSATEISKMILRIDDLLILKNEN